MRTPPPSLVRAPSGGSFYRVRSLFHSSKEEKEELLLTSSLVLDESGVGVGGGVAGGETGGEDRAAGSIEGRLSGSGGDGARSFISLLSDFSSHGEGLRFLSEALHEVRTALVVAGRPWLVSSRCFCLFFSVSCLHPSFASVRAHFSFGDFVFNPIDTLQLQWLVVCVARVVSGSGCCAGTSCNINRKRCFEVLLTLGSSTRSIYLPMLHCAIHLTRLSRCLQTG